MLSSARLLPLAAVLLLATPGVAHGQNAVQTYWTDVELGENGCKDVTVQPGPTEIARLPGGDSLTVSHAGQTYGGIIDADGRFSTAPRDLVFGTTTYSIAITGQVAGDGFTARVTVAVKEQGADRGCSYTVKWTGRKAR